MQLEYPFYIIMLHITLNQHAINSSLKNHSNPFYKDAEARKKDYTEIDSYIKDNAFQIKSFDTLPKSNDEITAWKKLTQELLQFNDDCNNVLK